MKIAKLVAVIVIGFGFPCLLDADILVRIPSTEGSVHQIAEVRGQVWLAMDLGAYRIEKDAAVPILQDTLVWSIAEIQGTAWLGTVRGIYRVSGNRADPFLQDTFGSIEVLAIRQFDGAVWLGTSRGLYRINLEATETVELIFRGSVYGLDVFRNSLWVAAQHNAYRIEPGGALTPLLDEPVEVASETIVEAGSELWLLTTTARDFPGPIYHLEQSHFRPVFPNYRITSIADISGKIWLGTTDGLFYMEGNGLRVLPVSASNDPVNAVENLGGEPWVGTTHKAYHRVNGKFIPIPNGEAKIQIKGFFRSGGKTWIRTTDGAYRLDEGIHIAARLATTQILGAEIVLGPVVRFRSIRYATESGDPAYDEHFPGKFEVILAADREDFEKQVSSSAFSAAEVLERTVPYGRQTLHIQVKDASGNTEQFTQRVWVIGDLWFFGSVGLWLTAWLVAWTILFLAPIARPAMTFVMTPPLRRYLSIAAIPVALLFKFTRRYLLRRYVIEILENHEDYPDWEPEMTANALDVDTVLAIKRRRLLVHGESDVTEIYLKGLARRLAQKQHAGETRMAVPVFLHLAAALEGTGGEGGLECMVAAMLSAGGFTDQQLAISFFKQGGFVFLFDDLDELDESGIRAVQIFVDLYVPCGNFVVLTTSKSTPPRLQDFPLEVPWSTVTGDMPESTSLEFDSVPRKAGDLEMEPGWDAFICHAREDKESFVRPLAESLISMGLRVWYDEFSLKVGDSLRRSIETGLAKSKYGVVVISPDFLKKEWPQRELDGLVEREVSGQKVILPVWHNIEFEDVRRCSPTLADRVATNSNRGLEQVVKDLLGAMERRINGV